MPTHWTYTDADETDGLAQGDILELTNDLTDLLVQVHPHFRDPKYLAFIVLTQSCDLVRRNDECRAHYINLSVVRSLEDVLLDLLDMECNPVARGVYTAETKLQAKKLLERILNQNEQAMGLFYLHDDADAGIAVPSVALLRVTIAVRSQHYDLLREARRGRLAEAFRNRLGWLVGNIFSRVAVQDWHERPNGTKELRKLVDQHLRPDEATHAPLWVPTAQVDEAKRRYIALESLPRGDIVKTLAALEPPPPLDQAIDAVRRVVEGALPDLSEDHIETIAQRLRNDATFAKVIKRK